MPFIREQTLLNESLLYLAQFVGDDSQDASRRRASMKKHLVKEFGQAKGQRMYAQADRMQVDNEAVEEKVTMEAMNVSQEMLEMPEEQETMKDIIPPCDRLRQIDN